MVNAIDIQVIMGANPQTKILQTTWPVLLSYKGIQNGASLRNCQGSGETKKACQHVEVSSMGIEQEGASISKLMESNKLQT